MPKNINHDDNCVFKNSNSEACIQILEILNKIDRIVEVSEETRENVSKIKEAVYNPDEGIYVRLRLIELWKNNTSKVVWLIILTVITLSIKTIYSSIISENFTSNSSYSSSKRIP
jgi:hypothetical protein